MSRIDSIPRTIKSKIREYRRVLKITKKPDREELMMSVKVTGLGILGVGLIGFVIFTLATLLLPGYS